MERYVIVAFREGEPDRNCVLTSESSIIIGRECDVDLALPDTTISRQHLTLEASDGQVIIEDLNSTNGLFLNGENVKRAVLQEGDFLTVGPYTVVMRALGQPEEAYVPTGGTVCISYDTAKTLHKEFLEKHHAEYFTALYEAALLFGKRLKLDELLNEVLLLVLESLSARRGAVVIHADEFREPELATSISLDNALDKLPLSRTLTDYVLRTKTALLTEDALSDPRFKGSETVIAHRIGAAMCAPLCGTNRAVGVIYVDACARSSRFAERELEFLVAIGHVVGMAVENKLLDEWGNRHERFSALGQAIAEISHDVKNVLTGVKAGVDLLENACLDKNDKGIKKSCQIVRRTSDQVEAYLTDLLIFVKDTEIHRSPTYVNGLVQEVLDIVRARADKDNVRLIFHGGGHEPSNVDGPQLHRVLMNLIKNAVEACGGNGGTVTVSVGRKADTLMIQVGDTGGGIRSEDLPCVMEPLFTTKGSSATGLGLAITRRIVEQHGGRLTVASKHGKGSVFSVILPQCTTNNLSKDDMKKSSLVTNGTFKKCPTCGFIWSTQDNFLCDHSILLAGYQVAFEELEAGIFLFNHSCGTTLGIPCGDFRHFYDGPIFEKQLGGTEECHDYCLKRDELGPCPAKCECAYVREILQIIANWPKE